MAEYPLDPDLRPFTSAEERKHLRDRDLSAEDEQALLVEIQKLCDNWRANLPKPTREQMLQVTHEENRIHARLNGGNQEFWDGLEAEWRRKQRPTRGPEQQHSETEKKPQAETKTEPRDDRAASSTRSELDDWWKPIDEINKPPGGPPEISDDLREVLGIPRTAKEKRDAELLKFMPKPLRIEWDKADPQRKAALWEANERNFEAAREREDQRLRQYAEKSEKAIDMFHRLKEDPSNAHLLPPDDASMDELHKWYDEMSKPVRIVPFPGEGGYAQAAKQNEDTSGPPFDLAKFDPSSVDLSHLDWRERNRINARQYDSRELPLLLQGQNPWTKCGKPEPLPSKVEPLPPIAPRANDSRPSRVPFRSTTQDMFDQWDLRKRQELAERDETGRKDDQRATARAIEQAIHKALRQNEPPEQPKVDLWAEIKNNRAWYVPAFLLSGLPVYIATLWGPVMGSKTVPEWLAEHGWPSLSTLVIAWLGGIALIALVIIARAYQTAKQKRNLLASQRSSASFELTGITFEDYDENVQFVLARLKYKTGIGYSPKVEVKANLTIFDDASLRLPEFAGAWHGSTVRSKRFSNGDSADIVLGLVGGNEMVGYEYRVSKIGGVTFNGSLTDVPGKEFYVQAVFIARTRTDDDIVLFETTQWFKIEAGEKPTCVSITQPSHLW